jgi:1-aminocyclopropane-1-carboxylate deaminase/D-cysteine desulfhydrase-like pyridoxal-dependent ACC family enzyme
MALPMIPLGHYPTPVQRVEGLSVAGSELWIKRDDRTNDVYGGNKVRKLEWLLGDARERGAKRVVTVGAAGSHHVLATTYFGRKVGLEVEAVLVPQPATAHVLEVLRAGLALGLHPFPVSSWGAAPLALARRVASGARLITVGGSSVVGSMGYVGAAQELAAQVRRGELPEPEVCVVALGSGGTAGGLAAGFEAEGMRTRVVGVCVSTPPWVLRLAALWLGRACARRAGVRATLATMRHRMTMDARFLGAGYGHATAEGEEATRLAREHAGIPLDPTYTAKAFAGALWQVRARRAEHVLYWHTLSSAPMAPLLAGALREEEMDAPLRALLLPGGAKDG